MREHYDADELERLHVAIALDRADGSCAFETG